MLVLENLADPMHGPFLHGQSLTLGRGALEDDMRTTRNADGFIVEREGQRGVNFDWSEFYCRDSLWVRLDIPLPFGPLHFLVLNRRLAFLNLREFSDRQAKL